MSFDKILDDLTQRLRRRDIRDGAPRGLEAQILSALPGPAMHSGAFANAAGLFCGFAVIGATGAGIAALARHFGYSKPPPPLHIAANVQTAISGETAKILAAVDRQNVWHLSRTLYGAGSEIWERRTPFFYRQQDTAGETIIDDGKTLMHVIPPWHSRSRDERSHHPLYLPGRIVIRASTHSVGFAASGLEGLLIGSDGRANNPTGVQIALGKGIAETKLAFKNSDDRLLYTSPDKTGEHNTVTVEKSYDFKDYGGRVDERHVARLAANCLTHLPTAYNEEWRITDSRNGTYNGAAKVSLIDQIHVDYGHPLPSKITRYEKRSDYAVIDLTGLASSTADKAASSVPKDGKLQVRPESLSRDSSGDYSTRLRIVFDERAIVKATLSIRLDDITAKDDRGNSYVCVRRPEANDPRSLNLLVAPADPDRARTSNPTRITIQCYAFVGGDDANSSTFWPANDLRVPMKVTLPISSVNIPANFEASTVIERDKEPASTILEEVAVARGFYYASGQKPKAAGTSSEAALTIAGHATALTAEDVKRSAYWWRVAADEADRIGARGVARQYRLRSKIESEIIDGTQ